jgi:hypothetical protein
MDGEMILIGTPQRPIVSMHDSEGVARTTLTSYTELRIFRYNLIYIYASCSLGIVLVLFKVHFQGPAGPKK